MQYKINTAILVRYMSVGKSASLTDLYIIPTNSSGVDKSPILMAHVDGGLYQASFTPDATGWWQVRVHSATSLADVTSSRYYVGTTDSPNPVQGAIVTNWYPKSLEALNEGDSTYLRTDVAGNLKTRSAILTDEGSVYEPFSGSIISDDWTSVIGTGASISVANSLCNIVSGTTANAETYICRQIDFSPLIVTFAFSLSQRIVNQDIYCGFTDNMNPALETMFARFHFYGTDSTKLSCETQASSDTDANQGLNTPILFPMGGFTAKKLQFKIRFDGKSVRYYVGLTIDNLILVEVHTVSIPNPYQIMHLRCRVKNGSTPPVSSTTVAIDAISIANINIIDVSGDMLGNVFIQQNVIASIYNSSLANINAGDTFYGAVETTLGVAGIQVNLIADQNCTVRIQQSMDGTNWDIVDTWYLLAGIGDGRTFQAVASYFRIALTNTGASPTTYLRLQTCLCPVVETVPRALSLDGRLKVESTIIPATGINTIHLLYESSSSTAVNASEWQNALEYTIPAGYNLDITQFGGISNQNADRIRLTRQLTLSSYNTGTNTFIDITNTTAPDFFSQLYVVVTTLIGNTANDNITITYVNQLGIGSRTATVTIPKNSPINTKILCVLQSGDFGIRDITAISHSQTGQAGIFNVVGITDYSYLVMPSASQDYLQIFAPKSVYYNELQTLIIGYYSTATASKVRRIYAIGTLSRST